MKKFIKISSYILSIVIALVAFQVPALAAGNNGDNGSSLSAVQVIGGLAVLLLVILIPILKSSKKVSRIK